MEIRWKVHWEVVATKVPTSNSWRSGRKEKTEKLKVG